MIGKRRDCLIGFCGVDLVYNWCLMFNSGPFWLIFFHLKIEMRASIQKLQGLSRCRKFNSCAFILLILRTFFLVIFYHDQITVILVTENDIKYARIVHHSPNDRRKLTICLVSGSLPVKPPPKNLPRKNFIAPNDSPWKFRRSSIGELRSYLAPVTR